MKSYKFNGYKPTTLKVNKQVKGERLEETVYRMMRMNEPIGGPGAAPLIYTERKDGVLPQHDIRTDVFEIAIDVADKIHGDHIAKRQERAAKAAGDQAPVDKPGTEGTKE